MKHLRRTATAAWTVLMLAGPAAAAAPHGDPGQATLASKMRLVSLLLAQSPALQRIPQSGHAQAKRLLAEAQAQYGRAQAASGAGRAQAALELLDAALRQIVTASALVPDAAQQAALQRRRSADLREAVRSVRQLHKNLLQAAPARAGQGAGALAGLEPIEQRVTQAEALIAGGATHQANELLGKAYQEMTALLGAMLTPEPLVYGLKFDTPAAEFNHELARNQGYEELVPLALAQLGAAPAVAELARGHVAQSRTLRGAAQQQARSGAHASAIKTIQEATADLQRALRVVGVVVPTSPEVP